MPDIATVILVIGILLLLGIASNKLSARIGVPVLLLFLVVGMLAGSEGIGRIDFEDYSLASAIGTVALCLILFDGGLRTSHHAIQAVWKPAAILASLGVIVTAVITGLATSWILGISAFEGLLLGSIIGSTDASAVFTVLRAGGVNIRRRLADTLEVESGSNDPMAIFLTVGLIQVLTNEVTPGLGLLELFLTQLVVGTIAGVLVGFGGVWALKHIQLGTAGLYPVMATALAFLSFGLAAVLDGSGFLAVYLTGIVIGNRRPVFHRGILMFHDAAAWICQILMFMTLGLLSFPSRLMDVAGVTLLISAVLILVARPVAVFLCAFMFRFSIRELLFLSWIGLKGAVPITLATFPMVAGLPDAALMFDTVFVVVLVSSLIQGWTLPTVARILKLEEPEKRSPPVTLEISSLHNVDADIVEYYVDAGSRAAGHKIKELALPNGVVVALITRDQELILPQGRTQIESDDHVVVVLRPVIRGLVDRVFSSRLVDEEPRPLADMVFPLRGSIKVSDLEDLYALRLDENSETTLEGLVRSKLGKQGTVVGATVEFRQIVLSVQAIATDGSIKYVGIRFVPSVESTPVDGHSATKASGAPLGSPSAVVRDGNDW